MNDKRSVLILTQRRTFRRCVVAVAAFCAFGLFLSASFHITRPKRLEATTNAHSNVFVVASREQDDTSWIQEHMPDWDVNRYVVDRPSAPFTVPKNKGREAMVYLSYIIDHYDTLHDVMVFMHSGRYQWHNDDPNYDFVPLLQSLQLPHLISSGYTNLRCVWTIGCPSELDFSTNLFDVSKTTRIVYPQAFHELFPNQTLPQTIAVACCAQFALTRDTIRERPVEDYQRWRQWLLDTPLGDDVSGRVFEYSWHFIFGKEAVHCPNAKDCYCNVFGLCDLECEGEDKCGERWPYPVSSSLPKGWPATGWKREIRNREVLAGLRNVAIVETKRNGMVEVR